MTDRKEYQKKPCPICGQSDYEFEFARVTFVPEDEGWLEKQQMHRGRRLTARRCQTCGALQLFS